MKGHDAIVIGGGHNGLTTAAFLARAGRKVLLLESRPHVGGLALGDEFHPGYRGTGPLHDTTGLRATVVRDLELEQHGLRMRAFRPDVLALGGGGTSLLLAGDPSAAAREIGRLSGPDGESYLRYRSYIETLRPLAEAWLDRPPIDLVRLDRGSLVALGMRGLDLRRLGRKQMIEFLRLPPMAVADWLGEWFETPLLQAALALPAVCGTFCGPRSPGTTANLLRYETAAGPGVEGGAPQLIDALERAARQRGVEIRADATVAQILLRDDNVCGVELQDGEQLHAPWVAAACDPRRTLLEMLPAGSLGLKLERRISAYRSRGTTAQVLLALNGRLTFAACPDRRIEFARTAGSPVDIERAFDAIKYRRVSETPVLEIHVSTVSAPHLAPAGHDVVSILAHFAPPVTDGGWDDASRRRLGDAVIAILDRHAPGAAAAVVGGQVLGPADIGQSYRVSGGNIHHGEHALDQFLVRPTPECLGYKTPFPGLFLCGSGSHPGGGLTCAPGALAARAMLKAH